MLDSGDSVGIRLVLVILLLSLSAFFSSAETALTTVSKMRIRTLAEAGDKKAITLMKVIEDPGKMLSMILVGNNIVNLSASSMMTTLTMELFGSKAVGVATGVLTLLILVFGEITPKTMATLNAERLSLAYAGIVYWLMRLLTPVIFLVNKLSTAVMFLLRVDPNKKPDAITEDELRTIVEVSHEEGVIESEEKKMINNVFDLGDAKAKEVMVPRVRVIMADIDNSYEDLIEIFREEQFTRIPIYKDSIDNIVGLVNMKDLLLYRDFEHFKIEDILRKPYFTYENKPVSELLLEMKNAAFNLAIVMDEYGEMAGIITLEDIIEEIVGDVHDEYDVHEENNILKIDDKTYEVKGFISLHDLNDALDLDLDSEDFDSIGGFVIDKLGRLPEVNDEILLEDGTRLQVKSIEKNRIEDICLRLP